MKLQNPTLWLTIALRRSCCTRAALGGIDSWTGSIHGGLPRSKAPLLEAFGSAGLRAVYNFVVQDASQDELALLFRQSRAQGVGLAPVPIRSEARAVGTECVSTCRSQWLQFHKKRNHPHTHQTAARTH